MVRAVSAPTWCDNPDRRVAATRHGNAAAYNRHGCRCVAAIADRRRSRAPYEASPKGRAARAAALARQRASFRGPDGLTKRERTCQQRAAAVARLLTKGRTKTHIARVLGVDVRTVFRYAELIGATS